MPSPPPTIEHHASLDSTSLEARRRVEAGAGRPWLVIVADEQTAGRGRRGRRWCTVPGRSLAFTVVLPRPETRRLSRVTILAAVAAARALATLGVADVTIKWPNDLMRGEGKLGGLLVESVRDPEGREQLLLGLGLNLTLAPGDLPPGVARTAIDAGLPADRGTRERLLAAILAELAAALAELGGPSDAARGEEYRRRSWLTGRSVVLQWDGRVEAAVIADVTADGDLALADGRLATGEHVQLVDVQAR